MSGFDDGDPGGADRLALLLAFGRVGLFVRDLDSGHARWDACLFEMTGLDPAAGAPDWASFVARVHPDDREQLDRHFAAVRERPRRGDVHFRFCRPDGDVRLMHSLFDLRPGPDGRPTQIVGVMIDDSEAGRLLEAGERSRDFLSRALTLSGVSVWSIDFRQGMAYFNAAGYDILGLSPAADGMPLDVVRSRIHPQDLPAIAAAADEAIATGRVVDAVARYRATDGHWRTLLTRRIAVRDMLGEASGLMGVSLDLGGRDAERARADALAEQTRLVAEAMGVGFWQRNADGEAMIWDAQMYRLYGRDPARPPPTTEQWFDEYVLPAARGPALEALRRDIADWKPETLQTLPVRGDDGRERWVRAWTRRTERVGRRTSMGMHLDVSEQVRHEELQREAEREAERSARASREKSAFMSLMSHRLRTPLNAVLGFAQLMAQDTVEPMSPRQRERLARIDAAGAELLAMIDDVFELAAIDEGGKGGTRSAVPLDAVVAQLRESVEPLARLRGVALRFGEAPAGVRVATDRRLLGQSLRHLLAHAVRRNERGCELTLSVEVASPWARLALRDGGPRLTPRQRELLFDAPAMRVDDPSHGDPLVGLNLVRQALERLGVQMEWVDSDVAGIADTALVVLIPLAEELPASGTAAPLTLLCIEDNPVNLMLVQELVAMRPEIRFASAVDGEGGIQAALAQPPDVVLLDLHLPDIDGHDVLARLRGDARTAGCHVIALSANALPEEIRAARAQGFDDYWTKPIDFDRFLAGLDALARSHRRPAPPTGR